VVYVLVGNGDLELLDKGKRGILVDTTPEYIKMSEKAVENGW